TWSRAQDIGSSRSSRRRSAGCSSNFSTGAAVAEAKTKRTDQSVSEFVQGLADESRRKDCAALVRLMTKAAGAKGAMYGPSIVGFGTRTYTYADGRTADWPAVAFSPRKADLTLYVSARKAPASLLKRLGKHK